MFRLPCHVPGWCFALIAWLCLTSAVPSIASEAEDLAAALKIAQELQAKRDYQAAAAQYEQALTIASRVHAAESKEIAEILSSLAINYETIGEYAKAEPLYVRCLKIREANLGTDYPEVGQAVNDLARLWQAQGKYVEAEPLFERSLKIRVAAQGPDHPHVAYCLTNLGKLYLSMGQNAKAAPLLERSLQLREAKLGPSDPLTASSLGDLASLYREMGEFAKAEPLYQRLLALGESKSGNNSLEVAASLSELAYLRESQGQYAEALPLCERCLKIREAQLKPDHPEVGRALDDLARQYFGMGQYPKAEPLFARSLNIREAVQGEDHPDVAYCLGNLAALYSIMGQYEKAEPLYRRGLEIRQAKLGPDHLLVAQSLYSLASLYRKTNELEKAQPTYERCLQIRLSKLGPDHPDVIETRSRLAELYETLGQHAKAEPLYDASRLIAIRHRTQGIEHYDSNQFREAVDELTKAIALDFGDHEARAYRSLALLALENYAAALEDAHVLVRENPSDSYYRGLRAQAYLRSGDYDGAINDYTELLRLYPLDAGDDHAQTYRERGAAQVGLGRFQAALADLGKAIELNPENLDAYESRADLRVFAGDWDGAVADWNTLVNLHPKSAFAFGKRAMVHAARGDFQQAEADLASVAAIAPRQAASACPRPLWEPAAASRNETSSAPIASENLLAEFDVSRHRGALILPVRIGNQTFKFCLDTGCTTTGVGLPLRSLLGPQIAWVTAETAHRPMRIRVFDPPELTLGPMTIELKTPVACVDLSNLHSRLGEPIDGILGLDVLSQFVVRIDVSGQKVSFLSFAEDAPGTPFPLTQSDVELGFNEKRLGRVFGKLYPTVSVVAAGPDGEATPFMIDTGALVGSVFIASDTFKKLSERQQIAMPQAVGGLALSGVHVTDRGVLTSLTLGDFEHRHLTVKASSSGNMLGLGYLTRYVATFDFPGRQLFLKPSADFTASEARLMALRGETWSDSLVSAEPDDVIDTFNRYIELDDTSTTALNSRAAYWESQGNLDKAIEDYSQAIRLDPGDPGDPGDPNAFFNRGVVLHNQSRFAEALHDFTAALAIDQDWADAYYYRAMVNRSLHRYDAAIADCNQVIDLHPGVAAPYVIRGIAFQLKQQLTEAMQDYNEAIRLDPRCEEAFLVRGLAWYKKGELDKSIKDLTEAIQLNPTNPRAYIGRGISRAKKKDSAGAIQDFNAAIKLNPNSAEASEASRQIAKLMDTAE